MKVKGLINFGMGDESRRKEKKINQNLNLPTPFLFFVS